MSQTAPHCLIELGHAYLSELTDDEPYGTKKKYDSCPSLVTDPEIGSAESLLSALSTAGASYDVFVVLDDTDRTYESVIGTTGFEAFRTSVAEQYVQALPVPVDGYIFESAFGTALDDLWARLPKIGAGDLGKPNAWGIHEEASKPVAYLYGEHEHGSPKPKAKLEDRRPRTPKTTPYTCQAYDAAIAMVKTGLLETVGPLGCLRSPTHAITLHRNSFYRSEPHQKSTVIQDIVRNHVDVDGIPHLEMTHDPDLETILPFLNPKRDSHREYVERK